MGYNTWLASGFRVINLFYIIKLKFMDWLKRLYYLWKERHFKPNLEKLPEDARDIGFFFGSYEPKHTRKVLKTISVKNQSPFNTCGWVSATSAKEIDEDVELSERYAVALARKLGLLRGDGFSNLRDNERLVQKYGICEKKLLPDNSYVWDVYSSSELLTQERAVNAEKHRSGSYVSISNRKELMKAIDEGHSVRIGTTWKSSFNMGGGLREPFILDFSKGRVVGAHAIQVKGYDLNYHGKQVAVLQNSYSEKYGTKDEYGQGGTCYMEFDDLEREIRTYGAYMNTDIPKDVAKFLAENNGKAVKELNSPDLYLIKNSKKHKINNMLTAWAYNISDKDIKEDNDNCLLLVEAGEPLNYFKGENVDLLHSLAKRLNDGELKKEFSKNHPELTNLFNN